MSDELRHRAELRVYLQTVIDEIASLGYDFLGYRGSAEKQAKLVELSRERDRLVAELEGSPVPPGQDNADDMEREDMKMLFEVRSDIALLRREVEELRVLINLVRENCAPVAGSLPPALLNVMIVVGLVTMAALVIITLRLVA